MSLNVQKDGGIQLMMINLNEANFMSQIPFILRPERAIMII